MGFGILGHLALAGVYFVGISVAPATDWLGTLWYLLVMILAVREVERLSWGPSIGLALLGFAVNGVVQFIFIR